jgi:kumamolisin
MARVLKFARDAGLTAEKADMNSGQVKLTGKVKDFSRAFNVELDDYKNGSVVNRELAENLSVPRNLASDVQGIFGVDNRQIKTTSDLQLTHSPARQATAGIGDSFLPNELADMYNFPKESMGGGQAVAILEFAGGLDPVANDRYYKDNGLQEPKIQTVKLDGVSGTPGTEWFDSEVALDSQVIGAVAPEANQQLIFAPYSKQGWVDAITRATFPENGEKQNSAISISWGDPESQWSDQEIQNIDMAFKKAALKGISIFVASGDEGAKGRFGQGKYCVQYPASDPWVTATGGTKFDENGKEVAWKGSGGGISTKFDVPDFQKGITLPPDIGGSGKPGRGVPDIAGIADGYRIRVKQRGDEETVGGTSAVAPLYAALMMRVNGALGHPVGYLNPFLYQNGNSGIFNDITEGNNEGYNAGPGWDAVTGWGSIKGDKFLELLRQQGK